MLTQATFIIQGYRERCTRPLAGFTCDFVPFEVLAAAGLVPLVIPRTITNGYCVEQKAESHRMAECYDFVVFPKNCCSSPVFKNNRVPALDVVLPGGYGTEAHGPLNNEINRLLARMGLAGTGTIPEDNLREYAVVYNGLRRVVRGISTLRRSRPRLLSHDDFQVLMDAVMVFPVDLVIESIFHIHKALTDDRDVPEAKAPHVMVYGGSYVSAGLLDDIEEEGIIIAEDDMCGGRRQFDLSINTESLNLYDEIIDAFTYRPLCPVVRSVEERHSLLYVMLKGQGIETVLFLSDGCCRMKKKDIEYLRVRLMRSGIDPVVLAGGNESGIVREYLKKR